MDDTEAGRESADLWLLNSCTVKDPSQAAFVNLLKAGRNRRRPLPRGAADGTIGGDVETGASSGGGACDIDIPYGSLRW